MLVYKYGCKKIDNNLPQEVFEQFRLQNQYWNKLVELDRENQRKYQEIVNGTDEKLQDIENKIAEQERIKSELQNEIKRKKQKARKNVDTSDLNQQVKECNSKKKALYQERKQVREKRKIEVKPQLKELEQERRDKVKELRTYFRQEKGLYWGNYLPVEKKYKVARDRMIKEMSENKNNKATQLNFHKFTGEGKLAVQLQNGGSLEQVFGGKHTYLQIDQPPPEAFWSESKGERRKNRKTTARIRIGSNPDKTPVWFEFPVTIHRMPPPGSKIQWAELQRKRIGKNWRWELNLYVETSCSQGCVYDLPDNQLALDLGWRKFEDRIRIAAYKDSKGHFGEVSLDSSFLQTDGKIQKLQSTMDQKFDTMRNLIISWKEDGLLPDWMNEQLKFARKWRSPAKLIKIANIWAENRFDGDREMFEKIIYWKQKHQHLWDWMAEDFDLSECKKAVEPEDGIDKWGRSRNNSSLGSPGIFRDELKNACAKTGAKVVEVDRAYTTITCPACSRIVVEGAGDGVELHCEHCGFSYDRDMGAAENILKKGSRTLETETT